MMFKHDYNVAKSFDILSILHNYFNNPNKIISIFSNFSKIILFA